jgi:DMSO/TMAO reductase YedYZ molybdopterin-dependent catalytic subunit
MNGEPLPQSHGFPLRLIAPGWYGIANTKWLQRIDVLPTRYENRFMARDYVTIREQVVDGQSVWTETSVGRALLNGWPRSSAQRRKQHFSAELLGANYARSAQPKDAEYLRRRRPP